MTIATLIGSGICQEVGAPQFGRQDQGWSPGGPQDRFSLRLGNIMLGQDDFTPGLEIVFADTLELSCDGLFVLTGAERRQCRLERASAGSSPSEPVGHATVTLAQRGDRLILGEPQQGFRTYLCFAPLARVVGGSPVARVGRRRPSFREVATFLDPENRIRVLEGPEGRDLFDPAAFLDQAWMTTSAMDEMGIRLACRGLSPKLREPREMVSAPVNDGTIQLTPKGPIVLLRRRPTIGGYPRLFNVIGPDVDLLGQYGPGQVIRFREVTLEESRQIAARQLRDLDEFRLTWARGNS